VCSTISKIRFYKLDIGRLELLNFPLPSASPSLFPMVAALSRPTAIAQPPSFSCGCRRRRLTSPPPNAGPTEVGRLRALRPAEFVRAHANGAPPTAVSCDDRGMSPVPASNRSPPGGLLCAPNSLEAAGSRGEREERKPRNGEHGWGPLSVERSAISSSRQTQRRPILLYPPHKLEN
jgi:hypothetical protein